MKLTKQSNVEVLPQTVNKLTPHVEDALVLEAQATPSLSAIAARVGVPYRTLRYWIQLGEEGDDRYMSLVARLAEAREKHEDRYLKNLEEVANTDNPKAYNAKVRANEMLLKKLFPKEWGDQVWVKTMIERDIDGFDLKALPTPILREFMKTIKVIRAANEGADENEIKRLVAKIKIATTENQQEE